MEYFRKSENRRYLTIIIVGIFLILIGISIQISNYINEVKQDNINEKKVEHFFHTSDVGINVSQEDEDIQNVSDNQESSDYIAVLEIPKVNLKRGIVARESTSNNVDKNIYILPNSILPDEGVNSHILLASHSGNSYISYFRNLNKLDINDEVYFYYQGVKYIYEVSNKYEIEKTGSLQVKFTNSSDITLITCVDGTNKQLVYLAKLVDKINY